MNQKSIAARAIQAVLLTVGFYAIAIILIVLLLTAGLLAFKLGGLGFKLLAVAWVAAGTIAWAILPRYIKYEAPGPELTAKEFPQLFQVIDEVAAKVNQKPPQSVYLLPEVNAFVAEISPSRFGDKKRIMGIGLPLLLCNSREQFRAVLTHEFGHYHQGDTKLGPWIYSTRAAIGRTITSLAAKKSVWQYPFIWYGETFMRLTQEVSRSQEFVADKLAADLWGNQVVGASLANIEAYSSAFEVYWQSDILPVVSQGFRPPIMSGFSAFLNTEETREPIQKSYSESLKKVPADAFDSHPTLSERLEALSFVPPETIQILSGQTALELIGDVDKAEESLIRFLGAQEHSPHSYQFIEWKDVGRIVYPKMWADMLSRCATCFQGINVRSIPDHLQPPYTVGQTISSRIGNEVPEAHLPEFTAYMFGTALASCLIQKGWRMTVGPGRPAIYQKDGASVMLRDEIGKLARGERKKEEWMFQVEQWGVADAELGVGLSLSGDVTRTSRS